MRKAKYLPDIKASLRWKEDYQHVCKLAENHPKTCYVYMANREDDLHDLIE